MGTWPDRYSGRIYDARGETWFEIDEAMQYGWRGLRGAPSLRSFVLRLKKPKALKTRNKR